MIRSKHASEITFNY